MVEEHSVSQWIASLKSGQEQAVEELWKRYIDKLMELARRRLEGVPKRAADEEDIAQSVFLSLCRGAAEGRFGELANRDDLWWLLLAITKQKTVNLVRRETAQKRGSGRVQPEAVLAGSGSGSGGFSLDQLISEEPTPEFLAMIDEQNRHLLGLLRDDELRTIAVMRIEGFSVREIADALKLSARSIERKLQLIRTAWTRDLIRAEQDSQLA